MPRPDEGMIHAWLDGELDAAGAARVEELVRDDAEWAAAAAEARGFIAASARIVGALDHVPANVIPQSAPVAAPIAARDPGHHAKPSAGGRGAPWWTMRVAALLVLTAGTAVVLRRSGPDAGTSALATTQVGQAPVASAPLPPARARTDSSPKVKDKTDRASRAASAEQKVRSAAAPTIGNAPLAKPSRRDAGGTAPEPPAGTRAASSATSGATSGATSDAVAAPRAAIAASALDEARQREPLANAVASEECYREASAQPGARPTTHRVSRTSDSTALALDTPFASAAPAAPAAGAARSAPATQAKVLRAEVAAPQPMRVRGDTLVISEVNGVRRVALHVSCPAP